MLGNSCLLLPANCTVGRGKFCVLIQTCGQYFFRAFSAHHVAQQEFKSHLLHVVLSCFQSWSCPSELPGVSLGFAQGGRRSRCGVCLSSDSTGSGISYWIWKGLLSPLLWRFVSESERAEQVAAQRGMSGLHIHGISRGSLCWEPTCSCWNENPAGFRKPLAAALQGQRIPWAAWMVWLWLIDFPGIRLEMLIVSLFKRNRKIPQQAQASCQRRNIWELKTSQISTRNQRDISSFKQVKSAPLESKESHHQQRKSIIG